MMKRLLFSAISALFAFSANAEVGVGDYVYTPGGRYLLGELKTELALDAELTGWNSINKDEVLSDNFQVVDGFVSAVTAANTKGLYRSFKLADADKTYVVVFDAVAPVSNLAYCFTPKFMGAAQHYIAHLNVYATDGEYVSTATAAATVSAQSDLGLGLQLSSEKQTYATAITNGGSDLTWFFEMSQLLTGISVGNIKVYEATQVYDNRFVQNKIDYLNAIINVYDWESMDKTAEETRLWNFIKAAPENLTYMADITSVEDGEKTITAVNDSIAKFFGAFFGDYAAENNMKLLKRGGSGKAVQGQTFFGWTKNDNRWYQQRAVDDYYWGNYGFGYNNSATFTQTKNLAAGYYVFAIDAYMTSYGKKQTIENNGNGYYQSANCRGELTLSILDSEGEEKFKGTTIALDNQKYKTGVVAFSIPEGQGGDYTFKIFGADTYAENGWTTNQSNGWGGNGYMNDVRIYFKPAGKYNAAQLSYIEKVREQITKLRENYNLSVSYYTDEKGIYYWYKQAVQDTSAIYLPYLEFYETLTDDQIIEGYEDPASKAAKDAAEAEGIDVSDWDCETSYAKYINWVDRTRHIDDPDNPRDTIVKEREVNAIDSIMNRAVRPILRLNERFLAYNQHLLNLKDAIDNGNKTLNTRVLKERVTYVELSEAVGTANESFEALMEDPGIEDMLESYIPAADDATSALVQSITDFYNSGYNPGSEPTTIRNFDFENAAAFALDDPEQDPGTGTYTDATGVMTFGNLELGNATAVTFCNGFLEDGEWKSQGFLRVGNGDATVAFDEAEMVSGTDALHVSYDFYYGSLTGNGKQIAAGVYLKDAENANVSGIWGSTYDGKWYYNPFEIDGNKDFSSVGSSGHENLEIVDESNKTHFDFYLDYGDKTMFVIVNNAKKGTVNKRYDAVMENQNPVAAFVVNSNYNNQGRRCWFDNLVIEKITLGATDIKDVQSSSVAAVKPVKRIQNGKLIIEKAGKFFDAVGKRIK